jgi:hypothetical protein
MGRWIVADRGARANRRCLSAEPETLLPTPAGGRTMVGVRPDQGGSMYVKQNRLLSILATAAAVLALGAAPALAGENDDGDDEDDAPVQTAPAPSSSSAGSSGVLSGAPQSGVASGAGGTAVTQRPDALLLGLVSGALVLIATGGGVLRAARRSPA